LCSQFDKIFQGPKSSNLQQPFPHRVIPRLVRGIQLKIDN
jgi:hypothetical protein